GPAGARGGLPGAEQRRLALVAEPERGTEPAGVEVLRGSAAVPGLHAVRPLPHLEVSLGAVEHVVERRPAAGLPNLFEPVRIEAVVRQPLLVVVERPLAP